MSDAPQPVPLPTRLRVALEDFLFAPTGTRNLCLVRVLFGSVFVLRHVLKGGIHNPGAISLRFPRHLYESKEAYALAGNHPSVPGFEWLPVPSFEVFSWIEGAIPIFGALFAMGLFTRIVGPLAALSFSYVFLLSQLHYWHHAQCLAVVMMVLAFSPCADHYSVDAWLLRRRGGRPPRTRAIFPKRLLQITVSLLYGFSFLSKLNTGWSTGLVLLAFQADGSLRGQVAPLVLAFVSLRTLSRFTVLAEGFLSFGLWVPKLRKPAIAVGVLLHLGIDLLMAVRTFSFQMYVLYLLFLDEPKEADAAEAESREATPRPSAA